MKWPFAIDCKDAFLHLFFPHLCAGCSSDILNEQALICTACMRSLPFTEFEKMENNPVEKLFWGRTKIQHASSIFYFITDSPLQEIIHHIKYKNNPALGVYMGNIMGLRLKNMLSINKIDFMLPMPLHPKKEYARGYNQASVLCQGIQETTDTPYLNNILLRNFNTGTQTKKSRIERWENVAEVFEISAPSAVQEKHILLIDDVITTGASTEACVNMLIKNKAASVSICSLAYTI
jgi:ComF family protein